MSMSRQPAIAMRNTARRSARTGLVHDPQVLRGQGSHGSRPTTLLSLVWLIGAGSGTVSFEGHTIPRADGSCPRLRPVATAPWEGHGDRSKQAAPPRKR